MVFNLSGMHNECSCTKRIPRLEARSGTGGPLRVAQLAFDELVEQHRRDVGLVLRVDVVHALREEHSE